MTACRLVSCLALFVSLSSVYAASWPNATPAEMGLDGAFLAKARDFALTGGGSGAILYKDKLVYSWGDQAALYDLKSTSKSIGSMALALALADGKVKLDDPAIKYHPSIGMPPESSLATGWLGKLTLRQLANQCAGFEKFRGFGKMLYEPGTYYLYSDGGPNWLAECLTLAYRRDLNDLLFERIFTPMGVTSKDITWRDSDQRPDLIDGIKRREFGSGFKANMPAMLAIGVLYLHRGKWGDRQLIPAEYVKMVSRPAPELHGLPEFEPTHGNASERYSLLWWNNGDSGFKEVPTDAFWAAGLYNSYIFVVPSLQLVVVRAGKGWDADTANRTADDRRNSITSFFTPIISAIPAATKR